MPYSRTLYRSDLRLSLIYRIKKDKNSKKPSSLIKKQQLNFIKIGSSLLQS